MGERARRLMSATEFLAWDDGTDTRYELVDGVPVAMAPGITTHVQIAQNVSVLVDRAIERRRPCRAVQQGGIRLAEGPPGRVFVPDVLMTCEPVEAKHLYDAPRLVVEVLSPSTGSYDKRFKLPRYAELPSIEEIWLIDSRVRCVLVWHRIGGVLQSGVPLIGRAGFMSHVLGVEVSLDAVYALTTLETVSSEEGAEEAGAKDADRDDGEHG